MTCPATLAEGPLTCVLTGPHVGHVFHSTSVMDGRHDDETGDQQ